MEATRSNDVVTTSCSWAPRKRAVLFAEMSLDALRDMAKWPNGSRNQILAWCKNRYPCGYMYVYEEPINPPVHF